MSNEFLTEALNEARSNQGSSINFDKETFGITVTDITGLIKIATFKNPPTEECYKFALDTGWAKEEIKFIKKLQSNDNSNISLEAVKYSGWFLKYVKTQTPKICLTALKNSSDCLMFVSIVEFKDLADCIKKLEAKLKLEKLINETI